MKLITSPQYQALKGDISELINTFDHRGTLLGSGARNKIKIFQMQGQEVNMKSFKVPNLINQVAYRFFRKSKAERSFQYAHKLLSLEIGTPYPIAYAEENEGPLFRKSFYLSEHLQSDLTFRTLVQQPDYPRRMEILRAFSRFTFRLHEKGVQFLDHSPGNTLIRLNGGDYQFFLVDLNRMNFKPLSFEDRMKNFSRLTPEKDMVAVMASEYAKISSLPEAEVFEKMWFYTEEFQRKFMKKRQIKRKLKFWKKY